MLNKINQIVVFKSSAAYSEKKVGKWGNPTKNRCLSSLPNKNIADAELYID